MFDVDGYTINISRGDTGAMMVNAVATLDGEVFTFGANDRALFSIKNGSGEIVKEKVAALTDNSFTVYFTNDDTDSLSPGAYSWDVRYIIHPYYDSTGRIVNGDQVITPKEPKTMNILSVVGDV